MIKLQTPNFLKISEDLQTQERVKEIIVKYQTPKLGRLIGWLSFVNVNGVEFLNGMVVEYDQDFFTGERAYILEVLTDDYVDRLIQLNTLVNFEIEL